MLQDPGLCVNQNPNIVQVSITDYLLGKTCTRNLYTINYLHIIDKGEPEEEDKRMAINKKRALNTYFWKIEVILQVKV